MDETNLNPTHRMAAIRQWIKANEVRYGHHPCFADLASRIRSIDYLTQAAPPPQLQGLPSEPSDDSTISLSSMTLAVQLDRCEAVIEMFRSGISRRRTKRVEQVLYPSLSTALLQRIIESIVRIKNRLGISSKTYSSAGLLHLCYIKAPPRLTKIISRFVPKVW